LTETNASAHADPEPEATPSRGDGVQRRAESYLRAFPDADFDVISAHISVTTTGVVMARAVVRHLEPYGINPARYSLLRALYFAPDRMLPQSEIAWEMGTSQPNVTQLLHALEKQGLVERIIFPANRRVTYARLKPDGVALCDKLVPDMIEFMRQSVEGLAPEELEALHTLLAKVRAIAESL
jgi:DNA-binding MarR family transcriptional regulator